MMNEIYTSLADVFEKLAYEYRRLVTMDASGPEPNEEEPKVTIEDVRAILAVKSQDGKTAKVKELLMKYDAGRLSNVKPEDYAALLHDAEAL